MFAGLRHPPKRFADLTEREIFGCRDLRGRGRLPHLHDLRGGFAGALSGVGEGL